MDASISQTLVDRLVISSEELDVLYVLVALKEMTQEGEDLVNGRHSWKGYTALSAVMQSRDWSPLHEIIVQLLLLAGAHQRSHEAVQIARKEMNRDGLRISREEEKVGSNAVQSARRLMTLPLEEAADWIDENLPQPPNVESLTGDGPLPVAPSTTTTLATEASISSAETPSAPPPAENLPSRLSSENAFPLDSISPTESFAPKQGSIPDPTESVRCATLKPSSPAARNRPLSTSPVKISLASLKKSSLPNQATRTAFEAAEVKYEQLDNDTTTSSLRRDSIASDASTDSLPFVEPPALWIQSSSSLSRSFPTPGDTIYRSRPLPPQQVSFRAGSTTNVPVSRNPNSSPLPIELQRIDQRDLKPCVRLCLIQGLPLDVDERYLESLVEEEVEVRRIDGSLEAVAIVRCPSRRRARAVQDLWKSIKPFEFRRSDISWTFSNGALRTRLENVAAYARRRAPANSEFRRERSLSPLTRTSDHQRGRSPTRSNSTTRSSMSRSRSPLSSCRYSSPRRSSYSSPRRRHVRTPSTSLSPEPREKRRRKRSRSRSRSRSKRHSRRSSTCDSTRSQSRSRSRSPSRSHVKRNRKSSSSSTSKLAEHELRASRSKKKSARTGETAHRSRNAK